MEFLLFFFPFDKTIKLVNPHKRAAPPPIFPFLNSRFPHYHSSHKSIDHWPSSFLTGFSSPHHCQKIGGIGR
jgi:hypothetical protein